MIAQTRIMLYVQDVTGEARFWQATFGAELIETNPLPGGEENLVLQLTAQVQLSLFSRAFIAAHSPEVLGPVPSLMLFVDNFADLAARLNPTGTVREINGVSTVNFPDPEGNWFVIAAR